MFLLSKSRKIDPGTSDDCYLNRLKEWCRRRRHTKGALPAAWLRIQFGVVTLMDILILALTLFSAS